MFLHLSRAQRITYVIILGLVLAHTAGRLVLLPHRSPQEHAIAFAFSLLFVIFLYESIRFIHRYLNKVFPVDRGVVKRIGVQVAAGILFLSACRTILYLLFIDKLPIELDTRLIIFSYCIDILMVLAINGGYFGKYFFDAWKSTALRADTLQKQSVLIQYENLRNQLNPHFLFNSLTSLNSLIFEDQARASQFVQQMAKVYRYLLQNGERETVSLKTEADFIQNYIALLKTRFDGALRVNVDITPGESEKKVAPATLQILIENAIRHNAVSSENPLIIDIFTENGSLHVRNNLQRKSNIESGSNSGLENMTALYDLIAGVPIEVVETDQTFTVEIPLVA
jgi:two-component system, LytTR family, sensor kinase